MSIHHYIAILVSESSGGWSVLFPDLPGCATYGESVHAAIINAADAAAGWLAETRKHDDAIPAPRSYENIREDDAWAKNRGLDWAKVVICLIEVRA